MKPFEKSKGCDPGGYDRWTPDRKLTDNLNLRHTPEKTNDLYGSRFESVDGKPKIDGPGSKLK